MSIYPLRNSQKFKINPAEKLIISHDIQFDFLTKNPGQTKKTAENLAKKILKEKIGRQKAIILGLIGDLGGGKTTFLQGLAKGLGIKEKILSPTFVILKKFNINYLTIKPFNHFYHIDCYRIQKPKEILDLGFREIISNPQNIVAIEWVDKIKNLLPKDKILIRFEVVGKNQRKIKIVL